MHSMSHHHRRLTASSLSLLSGIKCGASSRWSIHGKFPSLPNITTNSQMIYPRRQQCQMRSYVSTKINDPVVSDPFGIYEDMDEEDRRLVSLPPDEIRAAMPKDVRRQMRAQEDKDPKSALQELLIGANKLREDPLHEVDATTKVLYGIGTQQHVFSIFRLLVTVDEWYTYVDSKLNYVFCTEEEYLPKNMNWSQVTQIASLGMFCADQMQKGSNRGIWIDPGTEHELYLHPSHFSSILHWHNSIHMEYAFQCMRVASLVAFDQLEESDYKVRNEKLKELNETIKSPLAVIKNIQQILVVRKQTPKGRALYINDEEFNERGKKYICAFTAADTATAFCEAHNVGFNNILQMSMDELCQQVSKAKCHGITINRMYNIPVWRDRSNVTEIVFTMDFIRAIMKLSPNHSSPMNEQLDVEKIQKAYEDEAKRMEQMKLSRQNQYKQQQPETKITQYPDDYS